MTLLSAHIPFLSGAIGSILLLIGATAVAVTGYHRVRAMKAAQVRVRAEKSRTPHSPPRY